MEECILRRERRMGKLLTNSNAGNVAKSYLHPHAETQLCDREPTDTMFKAVRRRDSVEPPAHSAVLMAHFQCHRREAGTSIRPPRM